jgi:hypothetical protein
MHAQPTEPDQTESLEHPRNGVRLEATTAFSAGKSGFWRAHLESLSERKNHLTRRSERQESQRFCRQECLSPALGL